MLTLGATTAAFADTPGCLATLPQLPSAAATDPDSGAQVNVLRWATRDATSEIQEVVPPSGWSPLSASSADLAFYGFPPRPSDPSSRADWEDEFSSAHYTGVAAPAGALCEPAFIAGPSGVALPDTTSPVDDTTDTAAGATGTQTVSSDNWGGIVDKGDTYKYVYGREQLYPTATNCGGDDTHAMWVGFGGAQPGRALMQNGMLQDGTVGTDFAWAEAFGAGGANPVAISWTHAQFPVNANDTIAMSAAFNAAEDSGGFYWHDYQSGQVLTESLTNAAQYYDGTTAELIDERTVRISSDTATTGTLTELRKDTPSEWRGGQVINSAGTSKTIRSPAHDYYNMKDKNGTYLEKPSISSTPSHTDYNDNWYACGVTESNYPVS